MAVTFAMAMLFAGCSQDEGNYDYHSLNEPNITGVPEQISVLTLSNIDIDPSMGDNITVAVHIGRIREKLEDDPASPKLLQTVWGVGYRLRTDAV